MVFLFWLAWIWSHSKPGSSQFQPGSPGHFNTSGQASGTHRDYWCCLKVCLAAFGVFGHLSWPLAPQPTAWPVHRPEHLESDWNKKGKGYMPCAWDSGTSGHVPFHRLSWTLPSPWTPRPLISSSETGDDCLLSDAAVFCIWMKRKTCKDPSWILSTV